MTAQNTLDLKGNFRTNPFAELLVEVSQARLSGSLRLSRGDKKTVIYFKDGAVVYAVANARSLRLFNILLSRNKIDQKTLAKYPDFTNDLELSAALQKSGLFTQLSIADAIVVQIEAVLIDVLSWTDGEWHFSPLARLRENLVFEVDVFKVLIEYARCVPSGDVSNRFKSVSESFSLARRSAEQANLQAHEMYALSHFTDQTLTIEQLRKVCSIPEAGLLQALYVLWLGGILIRRDWSGAFTAVKIGTILSAKVSLVKGAANSESHEVNVKDAAPETSANEPQPAASVLPELRLSVEDYLQRMESSETHYDLLGVATDASATDIKNAYFGLAKLFHPDRFHREEPVRLRKIQVAFTNIAHAYETLKKQDSRETYDYKIRKELEIREKRRAEGLAETMDAEELGAEHGLENFEQGLNYLADEEYGAAAACLSRAVHYNPQNALYRAYYGQALSVSEKYRHKAESELQEAVKLEPKNVKIRLMLVEFFIGLKMKKRAEGELKRFLDLVPGNRQAQELLDTLLI